MHYNQLLLCRFGRPEECAGVVSFLCSVDASYKVTAETIVMAGGQQLPSRWAVI